MLMLLYWSCYNIWEYINVNTKYFKCGNHNPDSLSRGKIINSRWSLIAPTSTRQQKAAPRAARHSRTFTVTV